MAMNKAERHLVLLVLQDRVATAQNLDAILRWCGVWRLSWRRVKPTFMSRLDRMVKRGLLVKVKGGKGGKANRYTTPKYLMGFAPADKDIAADYAEDRGDTEKAALLRAARVIQCGKDKHP